MYAIPYQLDLKYRNNKYYSETTTQCVVFFYFYTMNIKPYLDSTYLKTATQAGLSAEENKIVVQSYVEEAIHEGFKLIMIRPNMVAMAKKMIVEARSKLLVGTVIGFPEGTAAIEEKLGEAQKAIDDGADDLDFVCNYRAFAEGEVTLLKNEILQGTSLALKYNKTVKWIIEVAALTYQQIIQIAALIKNVVISNFKEDSFANVFVKSSTGFYKTSKGLPNGATVPSIILMLENASPLPIKAAGGVKNYDEAIEMIKLGVKRIGTSSAKAIVAGENTTNSY